MTELHMTVQGKGGVGKSFVAWLLAQKWLESSAKLNCFDTDPVNPSFAGYKAFKTEQLSLGEDPTVIDPRSFDALIETIISADSDSVFVVDNGSPTFLPLLSYMAENSAIEILQDAGIRVCLHSVLIAGSEMNETIRGLASLVETFPEAEIFVWLNELYGPVKPGGTDFAESPVFEAMESDVAGVLRIAERRKETFGHDLAEVLKARQTFAEAAQDKNTQLMPKQRLKQIWRDLQAEMTILDAATDTPGEEAAE